MKFEKHVYREEELRKGLFSSPTYRRCELTFGVDDYGRKCENKKGEPSPFEKQILFLKSFHMYQEPTLLVRVQGSPVCILIKFCSVDILTLPLAPPPLPVALMGGIVYPLFIVRSFLFKLLPEFLLRLLPVWTPTCVKKSLQLF